MLASHPAKRSLKKRNLKKRKVKLNCDLQYSFAFFFVNLRFVIDKNKFVIFVTSVDFLFDFIYYINRKKNW